LAKYLTSKEKIRIRERHIREDDLDCCHCKVRVDPTNFVIAHLDGNDKNNAEWNHHPSHQSCNIAVINEKNYDYKLNAQEIIKRNHAKIYAPRIEIKNEHVSTEIGISVANREIAYQYLTERTLDDKSVDYKDSINSVTYLCQKMTGHGSQQCTREYFDSLCSSVAPFMIIKDENKNKVIQTRTGN